MCAKRNLLTLILAGLVFSDAHAQTREVAPLDPYDTWKLASGALSATPAESLSLAPGFKAELVRSAQAGEDSWIAMAFDPEGRLILAREKKGLLRLELNSGKAGKMEVINDTLLECRGLLFFKNDLYANANNQKTLVRLRDSKGTGAFDHVTELLRTEGGVGHGRNHVRLGPDGMIYMVHGNNVVLPTNRIASSALVHYADDRVNLSQWSERLFDGDVVLPAGHLLRFNPAQEPIELELVAGGMRNPLDVAFNREREAFTFDADMEWDTGTPWYVPNRILHMVSGADFGWRRGISRFPDYYPDTLPSVVDLGLASPTAVIFGYGSRFPKQYEEALYALDWAYGRIVAVHLQSNGATYRGRAEPFISGRPLNVTDACIGPDGAFWFITGGRQTQSGLYRVTCVAPEKTMSPPANSISKKEIKANQKLQRLRRELEQYHRTLPDSVQRAALKKIWPNLGHEDRWIRHAARLGLERIDPILWTDRALKETHSESMLTGLLALARSGGTVENKNLVQRLCKTAVRSSEQQMAALRILQVAISRHPEIIPEVKKQCLEKLEPLFPSSDPLVNRELLPLLVRLGSPDILSKPLSVLQRMETSEDLLSFLVHLRSVEKGWTLSQRKDFFSALSRAEKMSGGRQFHKVLADIRKEVVDSLLPSERDALQEPPEKQIEVTPPPPAREFVKEWKIEDLAPMLNKVRSGRSFSSGRSALIAAQCTACHRVSLDSSMPFGILGPDLISVGLRFSAADLLDHIMNPSKVIDEKFRATRIVLKDGNEHSGVIESESETELVLRPALASQSLVIPRTSIEKQETSTLSPMPEGLLSVLSTEEILDMLAFLQAGGDPKAAAFR